MKTKRGEWKSWLKTQHSELERLWPNFSSVQFSHSVVSDSLWPHALEHPRRSWLSPTPGVYSNSRPLSRWYHPTISSSVVPFFSCLQSFPASGSFQMSQFFTSRWPKSIRASASASVLPANIQGCFPLELTGLISLQSKGLSRVEYSPTSQFKSINSCVLSFLYGPNLISILDYWKKHSFDYMDICWQSNVSAF